MPACPPRRLQGDGQGRHVGRRADAARAVRGAGGGGQRHQLGWGPLLALSFSPFPLLFASSTAPGAAAVAQPCRPGACRWRWVARAPPRSLRHTCCWARVGTLLRIPLWVPPFQTGTTDSCCLLPAARSQWPLCVPPPPPVLPCLQTGTTGSCCLLPLPTDSNDCVCPPVCPCSADRDHWFLRYIPRSARPRHECFLTYVAPIHYNAVRRV